jgi:methylmalonyl-CoA mutase C-terminal domain/subunit
MDTPSGGQPPQTPPRTGGPIPPYPPWTPPPARVLIAKPGLDGHDRGAKIVARALRDAGFEVIFTGIRQRVDAIVATAVQEDVALVGLSILSGAHLALTTRIIEGLRAADAGDITVVVGGAIPPADVPRLQAAGAAAVFPTGTPLDVLVTQVRALTAVPASTLAGGLPGGSGGMGSPRA